MKNSVIITLAVVFSLILFGWLYVILPGGLHDTQPTAEAKVVDTSVTFEDIYREYKANELRAKDTYYNNRYQITATISGMKTTGLLNLTGGATLTMMKDVDGTTIVFYAEFEKDQEEALKNIDVGDSITFEGECTGVGAWTDCKLITE